MLLTVLRKRHNKLKKIGYNLVILFAVVSSHLILITASCSKTDATYYTLTFNSNGGSNLSTQLVLSGSKATMPIAPIRDNYIFEGWYIDNETFNNIFDFTTTISHNITLYAKWVPKQTPIQPMNNKIKVTVNTTTFTATLLDNSSVKFFITMLPLTLNMSELNGNEKYIYLSNTLPTNSTTIGSIHTGDLMLYGNNCLVLFYKNFNTLYNYTKLARLDNTTGLMEALSSGNVIVKFETE